MAKQRRRLTTQRILAWADAHYQRTGRWPTFRSGPVLDAPEEDWDWSAIDGCLEYGGLGLPGGSSLNLLIARHRGFVRGKERAQLSIRLILVWADRHYLRTGDWPTNKSGPIKGVRGETWRKIDTALRDGLRGLPSGSSLAQLLAKRRGKELGRRRRALLVGDILAWADAYHGRTGRWPNREAGRVNEARDETWSAINSALRAGLRGLPDGSSLAGLLVERRGAVIARHKERLTIQKVLRWADQHKAHTGAWPTATVGEVRGVEGESWGAIDMALHRGRRGLPAGGSISLLLAKHRGKPRKKPLQKVPYTRILAWADRHRRRTGKWPTTSCGPVEGLPGESWRRIDHALRYGHIRGTREKSLLRLLARHRGKPIPEPLPPLTIPRILKWADRHYAQTGRWPGATPAPLNSNTRESWKKIDAALRKGHRGLPGGSSLPQLLAKHRTKTLHSQGPKLTITRILAWADHHREVKGRWPTGNAGPVLDAPGESWKNVEEALRIGRRGLPGGSSMAKLLAKRRGKRHEGQLPRLTYTQILKWADQHRRRTGDWPRQRSGPVKDAPGESWKNIDAALGTGVRGLPGGTSLPRLLAKYRGRPLGERARDKQGRWLTAEEMAKLACGGASPAASSRRARQPIR